MPTTAVVWFRRDLRLADNPTLLSAIDDADEIIPVFVAAEDHAASGAWRAESLASLDASLRPYRSRLVVRRDGPASALSAIVAESGASAVYVAAATTPQEAAEEDLVTPAIEAAGARLVRVEGSGFALPLEAVRTSEGQPYRVFTPYHRAWRILLARSRPSAAPKRIVSPRRMPGSDPIPRPKAHMPEALSNWAPGEAGAMRRLEEFLPRAWSYEELHDIPGIDGTSMLSPHLAFGEITPRQIMYRLEDEREPFIRQLAWREFAHSMLMEHPSMATEPLRPRFSRMPWISDAEALEAWKSGQTGVPLVDAGMRQLLETGWMHNRVRMVAASWLTKNLLIDWREGERHFAELLFDAGPALNPFNWQWVAGSGADAAPYFRIMNPATQARRFDPEGRYIREWVPELSLVPNGWIHRLWEAPSGELEGAGVLLGREYPEPAIGIAESRERALAAYRSITPT